MFSHEVGRRTVLRGTGAGLVATLGAGRVAASRHGGDGGAPLRLRAAHLAPDAPAVDVYVDGQRAVSDLSFRSVTGYLPVSAGEHTVTVTAAGDRQTVVLEETVTLTDDARRYTAAVTGQLADGSVTSLLLSDATSNKNPSTAQVRVVHASPDAPNVSVSADGSTLFESVGFGTASDYAEVPAGDYSVSVGSASDPGRTVTSFDASLDGCSVYTVFATGYLDSANAPEGTDAPFGVVTTLDDSGIEADYETTLSGAWEVPSVDTDAVGRAVFDRRGDEMRFEVAATGLENVTAGHIHAGGAGENGPVVVPLFAFSSGVDGPESEARTVEGTLANGSFTAEDLTGPLEGATLDDLVSTIESGQAYVNVHTVANPAGEIRGNL